MEKQNNLYYTEHTYEDTILDNGEKKAIIATIFGKQMIRITISFNYMNV